MTRKEFLHIITSPYRFFRALCFAVGLFVVLTTAGATLGTYLFMASLPPLEDMTFESLKAMARDGVLQKKENKKVRLQWTPIDGVNRNYLYAIVMSEDSAFFEHGGINWESIVDSAIHNLKTKKFEYGGSTISQQLVKNLFLTSEKSISRKLKEVLITHKLEKYFSKNQILELYLNVAEFGPDIYGVHAAAVHYFKKVPKEINAAEGAFLALMLPSPRKFHYSVFENKNITEAKRKKIRRILGDMLANEFISAKQYRQHLGFDYFQSERRRPTGK